MLKFSAGPWQQDKYGIVSHLDHNGKKRQIASVLGDAPTYDNRMLDADIIRDANTQLIALAPEMYNVCMGIIDVYNGIGSTEVVINMIQDIISKIEK